MMAANMEMAGQDGVKAPVIGVADGRPNGGAKLLLGLPFWQA
jgi:hypothetical protein